MTLFATLCLALASAQSSCIEYICMSDADYESGACAMLSPETPNLYYIRPDSCPKGSICPYNPSQGTVWCLNLPAPGPVAIAYPGEPCDSMHTCLEVPCIDGICQSLALGSACMSVWECGRSLTCSQYGPYSHTCVSLAEEGGSCYTDTDCVQGTGCMAGGFEVPGTCVKYLSIIPNDSVAICTSNGAVNPYCASNYCYIQDSNSYCMNFLESAGKLPNACDMSSDCISVFDDPSETQLVSQCECAYNGNSYCQLFPGDSVMNTYFFYLAEAQSQSWLKVCNTIRNQGGPIDYMTSWCAQAAANPSEKAKYAYYQAIYYVQTIGSDGCVLKALLPNYMDQNPIPKPGFASALVFSWLLYSFS